MFNRYLTSKEITINRYAIVPKSTSLNSIKDIDFCFLDLIISKYDPKQDYLLQLVVNDKKKYSIESYFCLSIKNPDYIVLDNPDITLLK